MTVDRIKTLTRDETVACWAAMVALVEDVHAPQDQLTEVQWQAAEQVAAAIPWPAANAADRVLAIALMVMAGDIDPPDMPDEDWAAAERLLARLTAAVEHREGRRVLAEEGAHRG
jgi:hypothetical protein